MATSIGIRVYKVTAQKRGNRAPVSFNAEELEMRGKKFLSLFVENNKDTNQLNHLERSWFFDPKESDENGNSKGYIQYGTFGFESNLVNAKTKVKNYRRQVDDVEEIPLFYEFWCPPKADFGLIAFQSFQGRSCISVVMQRMTDAFETENSGYSIRFQKLLPNDASGGLYSTNPVRKLTLVRKNAPSDITDRYFPNTQTVEVDFEVSITAKKRKLSLGNLKSVSTQLNKNAAGVVVHDGIGFNEAFAMISVGKKLRRVGVFGSDSEAGVIDLTDTIERGVDGHPTFKSLVKESDAILTEFYNALTD